MKGRTIKTKKINVQLRNHDIPIGIRSLDRILTKIIGFRIQILSKCPQKVHLAHYFYQRVFGAKLFQDILGLSTLRDFFISEEILARRSVPTALTCR